MVTTIYFIRHAEPDFSIEEDALRPLTPKGMSASKKLVAFFDAIRIDNIVSSPYKRAIDTINPLAEERDLNIELIDEFRERKVSSGGWISDFNEFSKKQWSDFEYKLDGGESLMEVQTRNVKALEAIIEENEGKNLVVGSHGTALSTIINHYDEKFGYEDFCEIKNVMPWIVRFTYKDDKKPEIVNLSF